MYAYYGLSALGPSMAKYLWWKRYITQVQIVQFLLFLSYSAYFATAQRGYKVIFTLNIVSQSALYIYLFSKFYFSTYKKKKGEEGEEVVMAIENTTSKTAVKEGGDSVGSGGSDKTKKEE